MDVKLGVKTSEFWVTALTNVTLAIVAILVMRGLISDEEGELWIQLVSAVFLTLVPVAMAVVTAAYSKSRAEVKSGSKE